MTTAHQLILELTVVLAFACTIWAMLALREETRLRRDAEAQLDDILFILQDCLCDVRQHDDPE